MCRHVDTMGAAMLAGDRVFEIGGTAFGRSSAMGSVIVGGLHTGIHVVGEAGGARWRVLEPASRASSVHATEAEAMGRAAALWGAR